MPQRLELELELDNQLGGGDDPVGSQLLLIFQNDHFYSSSSYTRICVNVHVYICQQEGCVIKKLLL